MNSMSHNYCLQRNKRVVSRRSEGREWSSEGQGQCNKGLGKRNKGVLCEQQGYIVISGSSESVISAACITIQWRYFKNASFLSLQRINFLVYIYLMFSCKTTTTTSYILRAVVNQAISITREIIATAELASYPCII